MIEADFALNKKRARAAFERAAQSYDLAAVLQREVADRMLARLDLVKLAPRRILDIGSGTGYCGAHLEKRYRRARILEIDIARPMLLRARAKARATIRAWSGWFDRRRFICGNAEALPLAAGSVDMAVSNLTLQWCDPDPAFHEFARVLRPGGLLMFTSFGPDTLQELRAAWRAADDRPHVHTFIDMHDLGDALVRAGFADPVMDVERVTLTYRDATQVLRDLKSIGAHNAAKDQARGLTGKQRFARFKAAYERQRRDGLIPATYEVVYGHAWAPLQRPASYSLPGGAIAVPLNRIGGRRR